ncbi:MAG TPA: hypothetical protein VFZ01_03550 [Geminicoccaceae bacterium]
MTPPTRIARLLVAALDDDRDLERRPPEEVTADLEALGLDPAGTVALAKTLAQRPGSPATRLLEWLAEEDDPAEVEALERAPINEVRARVPREATAALAAPVRRQVGATTSVVPFRRRRLRVIGIGGSLAGLAAGLALVVLAQGSAIAPFVHSVFDGAEGQPRAVEEQRPVRLAEPEAAAEAPAPAMTPLKELRSERSQLTGRATGTARALSDEAAERTEIRSRQDQEVAPVAPDGTAFLLIDPVVAPGRWRTLALPEGGLDERLPAARRVADGRRIVALAAYGLEASRRQVVIVLRAAKDDAAAVADRPRQSLPEVLGPVPDAFEILPLD